MRAIRFREPPTDSWGLRDIFRVGFSTAIRRAVVIGNGVAGAENQCTGLVRALGLSHRQTIYGWSIIGGCIRLGYYLCCKLHKTIQHPRSQLNQFNLLITPRHDYYPLTPKGQEQIPWFLRRWITPREPPDRHVVLTVGALHQADSTALQVAACAWHDELAPLLKPLLVVNIGGPTSNLCN
ncbi:hypothetical protein CsSME_00037870 [Camellia sinensis var. sinensis]